MVTMREFKVSDYSLSEKMFTQVLENLPEVISRFWSFRKAKKGVNKAAKEMSAFQENQRTYVEISRLLNLEKKAISQQGGVYFGMAKQMGIDDLYKKLAEKEKKSAQEVEDRVMAIFESKGKVLAESEELQFREEKKALNERLEGIVYHSGVPMTYDELTYFVLTVRKGFRILISVITFPGYVVKRGVGMFREIPPEDVKRARKGAKKHTKRFLRYLGSVCYTGLDLMGLEISDYEEKGILSLQEVKQKTGELSPEEERDAEERGNIILNGLIEKWKDSRLH